MGLVIWYHMSKPKISCNLPSRVYIPPMGINHPLENMSSNTQQLLWLYSKITNPVTRWLPRCMSATLQFNTLLLCQRQPAQAPGGHPRQLIVNGQFLLAQRVTSGAADTGSQFKRLSDLNVTLQPVINTLRKAGLKTAIEKKRPLLSRARWQGSPGAPPLDSGGLGQGELVTWD